MYLLNDFLFHTGSFDMHIGQGIPNVKLNYATIIKPFDAYIWSLISVSVLAVMTSFVVIEMISARWTDLPLRNLILQSINSTKNVFQYTT